MDLLEYLGVSKDNIVGFGSHGHIRKSENHDNERFSASPIMKSKKYESEMKQNHSTELLGYSFPHMQLQLSKNDGEQVP